MWTFIAKATVDPQARAHAVDVARVLTVLREGDAKAVHGLANRAALHLKSAHKYPPQIAQERKDDLEDVHRVLVEHLEMGRPTDEIARTLTVLVLYGAPNLRALVAEHTTEAKIEGDAWQRAFTATLKRKRQRGEPGEHYYMAETMVVQFLLTCGVPSGVARGVWNFRNRG